MIIHTVQKGDTLSSIARKYMTTVSRLVADNRLETPDTLAAGQTLVVQHPELTYTVGRNDTLSSVAEKFGTSVMELYRNNPRILGLTDNPLPVDLLALKGNLFSLLANQERRRFL